ncbi:type II toxin-antitoxin system RnlB family antitoxin [Clostridium sp.]|uniref:type II toxin-antitoxin system RnlB family antitoxin n=1 Tax=Clostridium sp. TaxID=1506 RepID=UPI002900BB3A|nr:type II toxin-antitoxin system RnlB family antitoxin [Clostridium sp.]MDU7261476.1 type II toxin-antitoxin system RnlB family antitoxin [Clostridium butyricum]MDU1071521.1 type II toxin-antitoxin system RnlB family antitoxin [Clostridium sp.]MDU2679489.1 type II toxin-antitoxin system RnlB family antitoxin [Clostridium sp.]MDU4214026.1 type II toxin-antitoxin system RnlB family antitoxin [Clostridium sp.]MDU5176903.1 type II toxin-antitoxin system RnlB family antitoxin [Clostridium sp.]
MKMYNIIKLENLDYDSLVIMCNANSPIDYLPLIYNELKKINIEGKIIIDEILHVGNTSKRFITFDFNNKLSLEEIKMDFVNVKKDNKLRKISCEYLRKNDLIEYSILSSIQKRMINKGIVI